MARNRALKDGSQRGGWAELMKMAMAGSWPYGDLQ